jgi:hypothetical protein
MDHVHVHEWQRAVTRLPLYKVAVASCWVSIVVVCCALPCKQQEPLADLGVPDRMSCSA